MKLHTDVWVHDRLEVSDDDELVSWAYSVFVCAVCGCEG